MASVVFISPPVSTEQRYGVRHQSGGETPPLGIAMLAAVCRDHGHRVSIIDAPAQRLTCSQTLDMIQNTNPDFVGLTATSISIFSAAELADMIKQSGLQCRTIIGGSQFTSTPEKSLAMFPSFDIGCIGEGEATIIELLSACEQGTDLVGVPGLAVRTDKGVILTPRREFIMDLDALPFPAWDLLPDLAETYCPPIHTVEQLPATLLVPTRGCPGQCTFCDRSVFGRKCRSMSARRVVEMIRHLKDNYGIREIQFRDDNIVAYRKFLKEFCVMMTDCGMGVTWSCVGRVDMVNPEILALMRAAGCWSISFGIESGDQKVLDEIKKNTTPAQIEQAVQWTHEAGIESVGFFMAGNPLESGESMGKTLDLIRRLPLDSFHMTFFTPHPGTEVYENVDRYGVFEEDWSKMNEWYPVFIPHGLSREELTSYWKKAIRSFYLRPRIMLRYLKKIRSMRHLKVFLNGFMAFLEALARKR